MYKIRGSDQKEYGPVSGEVLKQWIAEGRVTAQTSVLEENSPLWKPASGFAEFGEALRAANPPPVPGGTGTGMPAGPATPPRTCGMATASLVLGVVGCLGITGLIGLILGILALVKISKSQGRLTGQGLAIAGVCVSGLMLLFSVPFLAGLTLPALARAKGKAQTINCVNNMKQVGLGMRMYAADHNETFPPAATWCDAIQQNLGSPNVLRCPADPSGQRCSYAFNRKLSGVNTSQANPQTVLIFECSGGWNISGGPQDLNTRHFGTYTVGFVDGSVRQVSGTRLATLRWEP
jgi:hypothetical protein